MTGPASAQVLVPTVGPGEDARGVPLARWALSTWMPVICSGDAERVAV